MKNAFRLALVGHFALCFGISLLTGCSNPGGAANRLAKVDLRHASVGNGRVNNNNYDPGSVLVLHMPSNQLSSYTPIKATGIFRRIPETGDQGQEEVSALSETDIDVMLPTGTDVPSIGADAIFSIKQTIANEGKLKYENYFVTRAETEYPLPNDSQTLTWRMNAKNSPYLDDPNYVFAFVTEGIHASQAFFSVGAPTDAQNNVTGSSFKTEFKIASSDIVKVEYKGNKKIDRRGQAIPAAVKYELYRLVSNPGSSGAGVKFERVNGQDRAAVEKAFLSALRS